MENIGCWKFHGLLLAFGTAVLAAAQDSIVGIASVIDGDTIEIHISAFVYLASTRRKAANSVCDRVANTGAADSRRALPWPTELGAQ